MFGSGRLLAGRRHLHRRRLYDAVCILIYPLWHRRLWLSNSKTNGKIFAGHEYSVSGQTHPEKLWLPFIETSCSCRPIRVSLENLFFTVRATVISGLLGVSVRLDFSSLFCSVNFFVLDGRGSYKVSEAF